MLNIPLIIKSYNEKNIAVIYEMCNDISVKRISKVSKDAFFSIIVCAADAACGLVV